MTSTTPHDRLAVRAMYAGLGLTLAAIVIAYVDHASADLLAGHIRAGYPTDPPARVTAAATTYLVGLSAVGSLGALGWGWTIWAVKAAKGWARWAATALFAIGTGVALTDLLTRDTSGDTGLAPFLGWVGVLPCVAGLVAVALLWTRGRPVHAGSDR